jgi:Flp pilus assembly protein TadG
MLHRGQEGASAVEFAIVLPILVLFIFGIIEFGFAYNRLQGIQAAAREGGRVAAIGLEVSDVTERVVDTAPPLIWDPANDLTVTVSPNHCTSSSINSTVSVTVAVKEPAKYAIRIPLMPSFAPDFSSTAVFRCERRR